MGLPATTVNVIYPDGLPSPTDPNNGVGWTAETTLDVTTSRIIAPGATIDLVVAKSNNDSDILSATQYVADHNLGDVVSQSFGEAEQCMDGDLLAQQHNVFGQFASENITLFASSGDQGAALPSCGNSAFIKAASSPATDPRLRRSVPRSLSRSHRPGRSRRQRRLTRSSRSPGWPVDFGEHVGRGHRSRERWRCQHRLQPAGLPGIGGQGHAYA